MGLIRFSFKHLTVPIVFFFTVIIGFILNEDSLGGAKNDFFSNFERTLLFIENFTYYFLNFEILELRHSPFFFVVTSQIFDLVKSIKIFRAIHLIIPLLIFLIFYECLKIRFNKIDNKKLIIIASIVFLSPTIRSYSIWPDSYIYGVLFFLLSVLYFLKHKYLRFKFLYIILNIFYLAVSSYFMPTFSIFSIFFFQDFTRYFYDQKKFRKIFLIVFLNFLLALPALYYIFYLDINFLKSSGEWGLTENTFSLLNISNKFFYSSCILFFHLIPFIIIFFNEIKAKYKLIVREKFFYFISILLIIAFLFSDYDNIYKNLGGGGIFYKFFNEVINFSKFQIFFTIPISIVFLHIFKKKLDNYLILLILLFSNFQLTIYHNYFEPIIYIVIFNLIYNLKLTTKFSNYKNIKILLFFNIFFLLISIMK